MMSRRLLFLCAAASLIHWSLPAQSIISVRSGVVHFSEGSVAIDGQPLQSKFGRFYEIRDGSELRTDDGRAEVLLTPGVLVRIDRYSSIRMLSSRLADTRIEFIDGSAALDSTNGSSTGAITLVYKEFQIHFRAPGTYRLETRPPQFGVDKGEAEVVSKHGSVVVREGQELPFTAPLRARDAGGKSDNGFDLWANDRSRSIAADNAAAAESDALSSAVEQAPAGTYSLSTRPTFQPAPDLWSGSAAWLAAPSPYLFPYPGALRRYNYIPLYRQRLGIGAYRPLTPIQIRPYTPPPAWHPPMRTSPPAVMRAPASPGAAPHRGAGHR